MSPEYVRNYLSNYFSVALVKKQHIVVCIKRFFKATDFFTGEILAGGKCLKVCRYTPNVLLQLDLSY